jgi:hypothetical protein
MADGESSGKKPRGFGFIVKIVAAVVIVLAVVVIVGDDETRAALLSRLRGRWPGVARHLSAQEALSLQ